MKLSGLAKVINSEAVAKKVLDKSLNVSKGCHTDSKFIISAISLRGKKYSDTSISYNSRVTVASKSHAMQKTGLFSFVEK